jgi:hypothetical protein
VQCSSQSLHFFTLSFTRLATALSKAHSEAGAQHKDLSLAYFLLRAKEPTLSRHVIAKRLVSGGGEEEAQQQVMADNQLLTLLNEASSSAFELDSISSCRLSDLEFCHRVWLVAQVRLPPPGEHQTRAVRCVRESAQPS